MQRFLAASMFLFAACTAKLGGDLQIDNAQFAPTACRSGQAFGFSGIEVSDNGGRRLRLIANADGTANAALFAPSVPTGDDLGKCGSLVMRSQNSRINNINNVEGTANLSCEKSGHKANGRLDFENCH